MTCPSMRKLCRRLPRSKAISAPRGSRPDASNKAGMAKLQKAAQDFEGVLINSLWGSMKDGSLGSDDDLSDPSSSSLEQLGMQIVSGALAKAGGLGIGKMIVHALESKA